jgi:nucleotide-binding universal stress UspA family protein
MSSEATRLVIAYDGSDVAQAATREAAGLFPGQPAIVATVWEPGLAVLPMTSSYDVGGGIAMPPDPRTVEALDRSQREHAADVAREGAELASSLGLAAEPHSLADHLDVAETLIDLARERNAAAIVVGSHGIAGLRSHLLGSVARKLIEHSDLPVVVVRGKRS